MKVFADEYNKRGGTWVDDPSIGPQAEHAAALNRIAGGDPPTGLMWNAGVAVQQLAEQGVLRPLDDLAKQDNLVANLPPLLAKSITYDGHVIAVPVDIGGANYIYYSLKVFHDLNMEPPNLAGLASQPGRRPIGITPVCARHVIGHGRVPMRQRIAHVRGDADAVMEYLNRADR